MTNSRSDSNACARHEGDSINLLAAQPVAAIRLRGCRDHRITPIRLMTNTDTFDPAMPGNLICVSSETLYLLSVCCASVTSRSDPHRE